MGDGDDKKKAANEYVAPMLLSLGGGGVAYAAAGCKPGGSPAGGECKTGSTASLSKCQSGGAAGSKCQAGDAVTTGDCQVGSAAGGGCKTGDTAAGDKCQIGGAAGGDVPHRADGSRW